MTDASPKKRSTDAADEGPLAKRPKNAAMAQSWADLTHETIGLIATYLPVCTPDLMHLLLCVGPSAAAVVRKMYLTGNGYYLSRCLYPSINARISNNRTRDVLGYWMRYNEEALKQRCLGKACPKNILSVSLTCEEIEELSTVVSEDSLSTIRYLTGGNNAALVKNDQNRLTQLAKNIGDLMIVSVGCVDVVDRITTTAFLDIVSGSCYGEGKIPLKFMRRIDAIFACVQCVIVYGQTDVLRFMIEAKIITPMTMRPSLHESGTRFQSSPLMDTLKFSSMDCFKYLLSLHDTDVNADVWLCQEKEEQTWQSSKILHSCMYDEIFSLKYLEAVLAHSNIDVNAPNYNGRTALCEGCIDLTKKEEGTIMKMHMLLDAGADPRIRDNFDRTPLFYLRKAIPDLDLDIETKLGDLFIKMVFLEDKLKKQTD